MSMEFYLNLGKTYKNLLFLILSNRCLLKKIIHTNIVNNNILSYCK